MTEVPPERIHEVWSWVRVGLEEVKRRANAVWLPEDIYLALKSKSAFLFIKDEGFCVLQRTTEADGPRLFIWALHAPKMMRENSEAVMEELKTMARAVGAKALRMQSPRKGWERCGWEVKEIVYEQKV
jgi:hypothetical protein